MQHSDPFVYAMYVVHALPYCNAAFNWLFYATLNSQLRRSYQAVVKSVSAAASVAHGSAATNYNGSLPSPPSSPSGLARQGW